MADNHHNHNLTSSSRSGIRKKWNTTTSPERTKVWIEPASNKHKRVSVVYYLSRNGQLEHPHFIEVPLETPDGLYLRDVISRLDSLRGKGMAGLYSWSCKRSYKSGFVWHDLAENDFIYPAHGQEYILKGSELLVDSASASVSKSDETVTSHSEKQSPESKVSGDDSDFPAVRRRRNQSWSGIDIQEYKVYMAESTGESVSRAAADTSTQTDDKRRRQRTVIRDIEEEEEEEAAIRKEKSESTTELSGSEISPPPSDSSPETLESLMKTECRTVRVKGSEHNISDPSTRSAGNHYQPPAARVKASSVLMQLITCGSVSFSDCGPGSFGKNHPRFSLISSHYKGRLPRGEGQNQVEKDAREATVGKSSFDIRGIGKTKAGKKVVVEDKEYFSESLIGTKKDEFPALKRSSSYNADRSKLDLTEEIESIGKQKTESNRSTTTTTNSTTIMCDGQQCSIVKKLEINTWSPALKSII